MAISAFSKNKKIIATKAFALLLAMMSLPLLGAQQTAAAQQVLPVLEFPEVGLDDTSTYRGYTTRFFKDSEGNTLQIYLTQNSGRVVNLWADAANESISFTARDRAGHPAILVWDSPRAEVTSEGKARYVQYSLLSNASSLEVGLFVLNTMRIERDYQYFKRHTLPFDSEPFIVEELTQLIRNMERLPANERDRHLALLNAKSLEEIRSRLIPRIKQQSKTLVLVEQPTFDGKNHLSLELNVDSNQATIDVSKDKISIHSLQSQPIKLSIKVGTDSPKLTPLQRNEIFNNDFFQFYEHVKSEHDSLMRRSGAAGKDIVGNERWLRFKRLERQVKSMELMSSQEKLLAGLPNYATYFGRDMMMSALMLEPVWNPAMLEHVIGSVLRKLSSTGEVSHEEALGGQAIRENAAEYNQRAAAYFHFKSQKQNASADSVLAVARLLLGNLQAVRENYQMLDDDFQLPVLAACYLTRADLSLERKRAFLSAAAEQGRNDSRLSSLLKNLLHIAKLTHAYVEKPEPTNLVGFPKRDDQHWFSGSWRDSGAGYANGRFAMDINAVWAPKALEAAGKIFSSLREMGYTTADLETIAPNMRNTPLANYARDPASLNRAAKIWSGAAQHFEVSLSPQEVQQRVHAKLSWLPDEERTYWKKVLAQNGAGNKGIEFLAISLDERGQPIPVANTDVATWLFLDDFTAQILNGETKPEEVFKLLKPLVEPYPVGLFIEGVGPVVANDAYASTEVWETFRRDTYHSPSVIWGREVNLLLLGLGKQILSAYEENGKIKSAALQSYVQEMRHALNKIFVAVEASGLKQNELWSYRVENGKLLPARYATSTDVQLWNLTDLAVQFTLARIWIF